MTSPNADGSAGWWSAPATRPALGDVLALVNHARDADHDAAERSALLRAMDMIASIWSGGDDPAAAPPEAASTAALSRWLDVALGTPSRRLAVYGTLAPGEENHHVIAPAGGTWRPVELEGAMGWWGRYPVFEWRMPGARIPAMLIESDALARYWDRLDAFETDHYARHLVVYTDTADAVVGVTNCYVRATRIDRVVAAILRRGDRVLLCHRHPDREWYPNVWDLPGGHVEPGEDPAAALARELAEELGVALLAPLGAPFEAVTDDAAGIEMTVWLVDYEGPVANRAPEEHDELRWVSLTEIGELALPHPAYGELLRRAARA